MWPVDIKKPSDELTEVLTGKIAMQDASEAVQSWARLEIYHCACQVLAAPTQGDRRNRLARLPAILRPYVETEAKRIWALRRK
jgi:hypothetical protein